MEYQVWRHQIINFAEFSFEMFKYSIWREYNIAYISANFKVVVKCRIRETLGTD